LIIHAPGTPRIAAVKNAVPMSLVLSTSRECDARQTLLVLVKTSTVQIKYGSIATEDLWLQHLLTSADL
jgi:hypothetical protein